MQAPRSIAAKTSSTDTGSSVEMGDTLTGNGHNPERSAQDEVVKDKVTELLMTLSPREQMVSQSFFFFEECGKTSTIHAAGRVYWGYMAFLPPAAEQFFLGCF